MDEAKAAAYYDDLKARGTGAKQFRHGLGFRFRPPGPGFYPPPGAPGFYPPPGPHAPPFPGENSQSDSGMMLLTDHLQDGVLSQQQSSELVALGRLAG
eukprot:gene12910-13037_t